jgi:hypothetical protein
MKSRNTQSNQQFCRTRSDIGHLDRTAPYCAGFEVFTAVTMKNAVFWDVNSGGSYKTHKTAFFSVLPCLYGEITVATTCCHIAIHWQLYSRKQATF